MMRRMRPMQLHDPDLQEAEEKLRELKSLSSSSQSLPLMRQLVCECVEMLDGSAGSPALRARCIYLHGAALNVLPEYNPKAEELLSAAVKLAPSSLAAWNELGECLWKKGNLAAARHCFECSAAQEQNAVALRGLSMVLRKLGKTPKEKVKLMDQSMTSAKAAVALLVSDPESWYVLGNTYLALFFAMTHDRGDLNNAIKAYKRAEGLYPPRSQSPDLYYNRAQVNLYLEDFGAAMADFRTAHHLDPQLPAGERILDLERRIRRTAELVQRRGKLKAKRLAALTSSFSDTRAELSVVGKRSSATLDSLKLGENEGRVVALRMLMPLVRSRDPPVSFLVMDRDGEAAALSVYHIDDSVHDRLSSERDRFLVLDPVVVDVRYEDKTGVVHEYRLVQVKNPECFLVNESPLKSRFAHAALGSMSFSSSLTDVSIDN